MQKNMQLSSFFLNEEKMQFDTIQYTGFGIDPIILWSNSFKFQMPRAPFKIQSMQKIEKKWWPSWKNRTQEGHLWIKKKNEHKVDHEMIACCQHEQNV